MTKTTKPMKDKLELKHLAPYLPYKLKVKEHQFGHIMTVDVSPDKENTIGLYNVIDRASPVLRPLSDLTKEIEHNGDKFVPIIELGFDKSWTDYEFTSKELLCTKEVWNKEKTDFIMDSFELPYLHWQLLFKWHFDVFNLINAGLAINCNDINKKK